MGKALSGYKMSKITAVTAKGKTVCTSLSCGHVYRSDAVNAKTAKERAKNAQSRLGRSWRCNECL